MGLKAFPGWDWRSLCANAIVDLANAGPELETDE